jgi:peptide/nickel transport system permease protein
VGRALAVAAVRAGAVLLAIAIAAWCCAEAAPGSPAERAARAAGVLPADDSAVPAATRAAIVAQVAATHGLDRSRGARLAAFVRGAAVFDFGRSWRDGAPVRGRVASALGATLRLLVLALLLAIGAGIGVGGVAVLRRGAALDVARRTCCWRPCMSCCRASIARIRSPVSIEA